MRSTRHQIPRSPVLHSFCLAAVRYHLPCVVGLLVLLATPNTARAAFDLPQYFEQNSGNTFNNKDEFFQTFSYDTYLKNVAFTDFKTLQNDRYFLWTKFGDGDEFLYRLAERFLVLYPLPDAPTPADLNKKIDIGELFLSPNKGLRRQVNEIYLTIGYFILGKVAQKISQQMHAKKYDESQPDRASIIQRLAKNRVYVSREESTSSKIMSNLKQGKFGYLWDRFRAYLLTHEQKAWPIVIGLLTVSVVFFLAGFRRRLRFLRVFGVLGLLVALLPLAILKFDTSTARAATGPSPVARPTPVQTTLQLSVQRNLHPMNNGSDHAITVYKLTQHNNEIGQAIWMDRQAVQVSYLAFENVPAKYRTYKTKNKVALATTGGYTNSSHQPEGFTMEDGNIVNPVIMPDRDGLAMVSDGGINVLNVDPKRDKFQLPEGSIIKNPLNSLLAYAELLKWCKEKHATLFQTHLLAYSDTLLIDASKASPEIRERRILALVRDKKTQRLYHIIFNVTSKFNLAQIASEIFGLLETRNLKVEAILNLDVGAFNILEVYDDSGNVLNDLKGPVDINTATNLLVYKT